MSNALATLTDFLSVVSDFNALGAKSVATVEVLAVPTAGDKLTISNEFVLPNVIARMTASDTPGANEFLIGVDEAETATNLAAALDNALVEAVVLADDVTVQVVSKLTGPTSEFAIASSNPSALSVSGATLAGGSDTVDAYLAAAGRQINLEAFGTRASDAHIYLTAHMLTSVGGSSGAGGPVKRRKIDKLEIEYAVNPPTDSELGSTKWGVLYLQLLNSAPLFGLPGRRALERGPW